MTEVGDKNSMIREMASRNPASLEQLHQLERQLADLRNVGLMTERGFSLRRPLAHPAETRLQSFHNAQSR